MAHVSRANSRDFTCFSAAETAAATEEASQSSPFQPHDDWTPGLRHHSRVDAELLCPACRIPLTESCTATASSGVAENAMAARLVCDCCVAPSLRNRSTHFGCMRSTTKEEAPVPVHPAGTGCLRSPSTAAAEQVEVCRICEFVWFDAGETQTLRARPLPEPKPQVVLPQGGRGEGLGISYTLHRPRISAGENRLFVALLLLFSLASAAGVVRFRALDSFPNHRRLQQKIGISSVSSFAHLGGSGCGRDRVVSYPEKRASRRVRTQGSSPVFRSLGGSSSLLLDVKIIAP